MDDEKKIRVGCALEVLLEKSNFCKNFKDEQNSYAKIGVRENTPSLASRNVVQVKRCIRYQDPQSTDREDR